MKILKCEVIIVGGGPAGATAARDLSRLGINTILLEKNSDFEKPCGGGLMLSSYEEFDIPHTIIKQQINKIKILSPSLNEVTIDITKHPLTIVHRHEFDATLRNLAVQNGVQLIEAKAYDIQVKENATIWAKNATNNYQIQANYIIAADGVNSMIRKKLLNEVPNRVLTYYIDIKNQESESCQFWFGDNISPKYYSWIFPHHNGINIGLISDNKKEISSYFENFRTKINLQGSEKPKGYYIPTWKKQIYYKDNVFFVGDSASMVLPFTYEGIYYAMKSARLAVEAIVKNDPTLYQKKWNKLYGRKFRFLKILQTLFLHSDYFSEILVKLYQKPQFQESVISYWIGSKQPLSPIGTILKFIKIIFKSLFIAKDKN